jgi:catechol 2,3-dioxygenase-like lactoylglutathione lyase family enzyme
MAELPPSSEGIVLTHFIVSDDVERSRRFYTEVLGGRVVFSGPGGLTYVALSNSISGSKTSRPCTPIGAPGVLNS